MGHMPVYDEFTSPAQMRVDAEAAVSALQRAHPHHAALQHAVAAALQPAPNITFAHYPADQPKPTINVTLAAKRVADSLHLHLD